MISRRLSHVILLAILCVSLFQRYPTDFEATGRDTFFIASFAKSVEENGLLGWIIHPLSLFGLFPGSLPSGGPALFAAVASLNEIPIGASIVLSGFVLTLLSVYAGFLFGHSISKSSWAALLFASFFALSPRLLVFTSASGSTRAFTLVFFPVILALLVKASRHRRLRGSFFALALTILFILAVFHRSFLLAAVAFPAFLVSLVPWSKWTDPRFRNFRSTLYAIGLVGLLLIPISGAITQLAPRISDYSSGFVLQGDSEVVHGINLLLDYSSSMGLAAAFVPIGLWFVIREDKWPVPRRFLLASVMAYVPLFGAGQYTVLVFLPLMALLAAIGLHRIIGLRWRSLPIAASALAAAIVLTSVSSVFMTRHWEASQGPTVFVDSEVAWTSAYLSSSDSRGFFVSNDWSSTSYKVWSLSGNPAVSWDLAIPLSEGVISPEQLGVRFDPSALSLYTTTSDLQDRTHWISLMTQDPRLPKPQYVIHLYDLRFFVEKRDYANSATIHVFIATIHETQYKLWETGGYTIWQVPRT